MQVFAAAAAALWLWLYLFLWLCEWQPWFEHCHFCVFAVAITFYLLVVIYHEMLQFGRTTCTHFAHFVRQSTWLKSFYLILCPFLSLFISLCAPFSIHTFNNIFFCVSICACRTLHHACKSRQKQLRNRILFVRVCINSLSLSHLVEAYWAKYWTLNGFRVFEYSDHILVVIVYGK